MKLCNIKRSHHDMLKMSAIGQNACWWSHLIWHNFIAVGVRALRRAGRAPPPDFLRRRRRNLGSARRTPPPPTICGRRRRQL